MDLEELTFAQTLANPLLNLARVQLIIEMWKLNFISLDVAEEAIRLSVEDVVRPRV